MSDPMFNRQNIAAALIQQRTLELWVARYPGTPWMSGAPLDRDDVGGEAFDQLLAEGAITLDGPGVQAVGGLA